MDDERYRPGLLDLNLQISVVKNFHHLHYQLKLTEKLETEYEGFKETKCAILNLRGAILFFLKDYEKACETFEKVLEDDDSNLNALTNLESIYRQLGCWTKADDYHSRLKEKPVRKATCYGEQGFAMMFDCHISSNEYERFKRSKNMFDLCLKQMAETNVPNDGAIQWHLWYAQLLPRLMNHCPKQEQTKEKFQYLKEGLKQCLLVKEQIQDLDQSLALKSRLLSVATAYLGIFTHRVDDKLKDKLLKVFTALEKETEPKEKDVLESPLKDEDESLGDIKKASNEIVESLKNPKTALKEVLKVLKDPETAFKEAVELDKNTEVICRYALFLKGKKLDTSLDTDQDTSLDTDQNLEEAEKVIDQCIHGDENGGNWFAFTIKSGIILKKCKPKYKKLNAQLVDQKADDVCEDDTKGTKSKSDGNDDVYDTTLNTCLKESIKFGIKAGEINATSNIYSDLGEAYHWLALNQKQNKQKEEYFFKALANFLHALQHAEGYNNAFIHYGHGKCLFDMKQYMPALESFKRAIECGTRRLKQTYKRLLKCYIELQGQKETREQLLCKETRKQLLSDLAYWIRLGNGKFGEDYWLDDILDKLNKKMENNPIKTAEIENTFAIVARKLIDRDSFPVSENYLKEHITFTLCIFGETMQLQNNDYSKCCIEKLDEEKIKLLSEDQEKEKMYIHLQNMAKSFAGHKEICHESPAKEYRYLQEETFLIDLFKQLHAKCEKFAEAVALEIKKKNRLFGSLLLHRVGKTTPVSELTDAPVKGMSLRELSFCAKEMDNKDETQQKKCRDCLNVLDECIEKFSIQQASPATLEHYLEPKVRKTKYEYDFSVIYSENDSQWVVHSLLPTLERKYRFRGYVENRDLPPGQSRFKVLEIFEKCYKVILILTENFCEDKWCKFVFKQALYGKLGEHCLIPIQKSRIKEMPKELTTIISLTAVQNLDWERLVKVLE